MSNFKQLIEQVTEARATSTGLTRVDGYYFAHGASLPNELLLMALEALEYIATGKEIIGLPTSSAIEARKTLQAIRAKLESEIK